VEQGPSSESNLFSAGQEIPCILRSTEVHYRMFKYQSPLPILSQIYPVHEPPSHFLKIHLNIIFSSMLEPSKLSRSLRLPHQNPVYSFHLPIRATCPVHLIFLNL